MACMGAWRAWVHGVHGCMACTGVAAEPPWAATRRQTKWTGLVPVSSGRSCTWSVSSGDLCLDVTGSGALPKVQQGLRWPSESPVGTSAWMRFCGVPFQKHRREVCVLPKGGCGSEAHGQRLGRATHRPVYDETPSCTCAYTPTHIHTFTRTFTRAHAHSHMHTHIHTS